MTAGAAETVGEVGSTLVTILALVLVTVASVGTLLVARVSWRLQEREMGRRERDLVAREKIVELLAEHEAETVRSLVRLRLVGFAHEAEAEARLLMIDKEVRDAPGGAELLDMGERIARSVADEIASAVEKDLRDTSKEEEA